MSNVKSKGSVDLLHGPIMKNLFIFMIPILIASAFQQLYNAVDTALVGNILGENSLAAIGACSSIFELLVGFSMSLANGFSIVIARAYGSRDEERMKKSIAAAFVIGAATIVILMLFSAFGLGSLLKLINTPDSIFEESLTYIRIIGLCVAVMFAYNFLSGVLRAVGNSFMPLVFLIISSLLNIVLDYIFMKWLYMGVAGAAAATVIAQGVSAVLCAIYIISGQKQLIPSREHFHAGKDIYADLAGQGYAMAFMGSIVSIGSIILQSGINALGTEVIAGHIAARKVYALANLPFMALAQGLSTFISQNKGAEQGDRIIKAMRSCFVIDFILAAAVSVFLWCTAPALVHMISGSDNSIILANGSQYLYIVGPFYAVLGVLIQTRFCLQGLGSKWIPLISSVIECVGKILFTWLLIPRFGYRAVMWCEPIIWCAMTAQLLYSYEKNAYVIQTKKEMQKHA